MTVSYDLLGLIVLVAGFVIVLSVLIRKSSWFVPPFENRSLMNKTELRLYRMLRNELPNDWTVMSQVAYGAFLRNKSFKRYMTVNSKRADFVVLEPGMRIVAVIEYQGGGHFGNTGKSRDRAIKSDRIKRKALAEAGVRMVEIPAKFDRESIRDLSSTMIDVV